MIIYFTCLFIIYLLSIFILNRLNMNYIISCLLFSMMFVPLFVFTIPSASILWICVFFYLSYWYSDEFSNLLNINNKRIIYAIRFFFISLTSFLFLKVFV